MLQKVMCNYTTPISKFKSNPAAALAEAKGDAIAVSSNNQIQFYAVPAHMYEELVNFVEFAQRGAMGLKSLPAHFTCEDVELDKVATETAKKFKKGTSTNYEYEEVLNETPLRNGKQSAS